MILYYIFLTIRDFSWTSRTLDYNKENVFTVQNHGSNHNNYFYDIYFND